MRVINLPTRSNIKISSTCTFGVYVYVYVCVCVYFVYVFVWVRESVCKCAHVCECMCVSVCVCVCVCMYVCLHVLWATNVMFDEYGIGKMRKQEWRTSTRDREITFFFLSMPRSRSSTSPATCQKERARGQERGTETKCNRERAVVCARGNSSK